MDKFVFGPLAIEVKVQERHENVTTYEAKIYLDNEKPLVVRFPSGSMGESLETVARNLICDLQISSETLEEPKFIMGTEEVRRQMHEWWTWTSTRRDTIYEAAMAAGVI